jgi:NhaP-type Na+/H+ or K+/H+ antiporter
MVIVLNEKLPGVTTLTQIVVWTVILSVLAHGLSASPLASLYSARKTS